MGDSVGSRFKHLRVCSREDNPATNGRVIGVYLYIAAMSSL